MTYRQTLLYDLNSLVGEVGGSLGLFLGMSLVHLYRDGIRITKKVYLNRRKKKAAQDVIVEKS